MTSPRRACLIVPGSSERMLLKARSFLVDEVVIDLEDAVAPAEKASARERVARVLAEGGFSATSIAVRVNASGSPWIREDLESLAGLGENLTSVVLPKAESAADVAGVQEMLGATAAGIGIQALIETAAGLRAIDAIAGASSQVVSLIIGYVDLATSLGRSRAAAADPSLWIVAQDTVLCAARAAGVQAIDGPFVGLDDLSGLRESAVHAAGLGFDGKWAIHPNQVSVITETFTPTPDEIAHARELIERLDAATADGRGALRLNDEMVDEAMRGGALRTLLRGGAL